MSYKLVISK